MVAAPSRNEELLHYIADLVLLDHHGPRLRSSITFAFEDLVKARPCSYNEKAAVSKLVAPTVIARYICVIFNQVSKYAIGNRL